VLRLADYPKVKNALEQVDSLIQRIADLEADGATGLVLSTDERRFYDAYSEHWVHADNRTVMTQFLCKQITKVTRS
jgi:hypothetical protein